MRTKGKFYDNLSKFQVSNEKKKERLEELKKQEIQKVELRTVKKVKEAISQAEGAIVRLKSIIAMDISETKRAQDVGVKLYALQDELDKVTSELDKIEPKFDKLATAAKKVKSELKNRIGDSKTDGQILSSEIMGLIEGARALGMEKPSIVEKGTSVSKKLQSAIKEAESQSKKMIV